MQKSDHTFVHYYDLKPLFIELKNLNKQYENLQISVKNNQSKFQHEFDNYDKIINYIQQTINDKINNFNIYTNDKNREKRGLIDGLGSIIKIITGNLDENDGKRINAILNHVQQNQNNFNEQLKLSYSLNNNIIKNFNDTIKDIEHNELLLKSRILQSGEILKGEIEHQHILFTKDLFNQLIILYNTIFNILQDIENSITFCKLATLHPSIIKSKQLFQEIKRISLHYNEQLPFELKIENILYFESILKIHCKIEKSKIIYFLSIPINYEHEFEIYLLNSIPTKQESKYITIIPNAKYLLKSKSDNKIWPLNQLCTQGISYYQCPGYLITNQEIKCEQQILIHGNSSECQYTNINIIDNHLEIVQEINQYLAVFPKQEEIEVRCKQSTEIKALQGIYLIEDENCKIIFRTNEIKFLESTLGTPILIGKQNMEMKTIKFSNLEIDLKKLNLHEVPIIHQMPIDTSIDMVTPSLWTIILYFILIGIFVYVVLKWTKQKGLQIQQEGSDPQEGNTGFRLPRDAKI